MLRSMWNGTVMFGMVSVPVKMYAATQDNDVRTHQVHAKDNGRISYKKVCTTCNEEVPVADIAKAVDVGAGLVVLDDEAITALEPKGAQTIEVDRFVAPHEIDPVYYDKTYYLAPDKIGGKAYALLREAMGSTENVAVTRLTMRGKTRPAVIRVRGDLLMVMTMRWPDEMRAPDIDIPEVSVGSQEVALAKHLISAMTTSFDADAMVDTRRKRLLELVESSPVIPHQRTGVEPTATVHDLMAALHASVAKHTTPEGEPVEPTPIRRTTRKKKTA